GKLKIVAGYPGGNDVVLAMERGEVKGRCGWSWSSVLAAHMAWWKEKKINILVQLALAKHPDLPDVPLVTDLAKTYAQRQMLRMIFARQVMGRPFVAPPGVPKERVDALRKAFMDTMADKDFRADSEKAKLEINPVPGDQVEALVKEIYATPPGVAKQAAAALKGSDRTVRTLHRDGYVQGAASWKRRCCSAIPADQSMGGAGVDGLVPRSGRGADRLASDLMIFCDRATADAVLLRRLCVDARSRRTAAQGSSGGVAQAVSSASGAAGSACKRATSRRSSRATRRPTEVDMVPGRSCRSSHSTVPASAATPCRSRPAANLLIAGPSHCPQALSARPSLALRPIRTSASSRVVIPAGRQSRCRRRTSPNVMWLRAPVLVTKF